MREFDGDGCARSKLPSKTVAGGGSTASTPLRGNPGAAPVDAAVEVSLGSRPRRGTGRIGVDPTLALATHVGRIRKVTELGAPRRPPARGASVGQPGAAILRISPNATSGLPREGRSDGRTSVKASSPSRPTASAVRSRRSGPRDATSSGRSSPTSGRVTHPPPPGAATGPRPTSRPSKSVGPRLPRRPPTDADPSDRARRRAAAIQRACRHARGVAPPAWVETG